MQAVTAERLAILSTGIAVASLVSTGLFPTSARVGLSAAVLCFTAVGVVFAIVAFFTRPESCPACATREELAAQFRATLDEPGADRPAHIAPPETVAEQTDARALIAQAIGADLRDTDTETFYAVDLVPDGRDPRTPLHRRPR
jgi:hypothetical protein